MTSMPAAGPVGRCPHCSADLGPEHSAGPLRCRVCRLMVGHGRVVPLDREPREIGMTVGFAANQARRAESAAVEPALVVSALRRAAGVVGVRVDALRMIDYRHALAEGHTGPTLAEVMATFGTWRIAREAAAQA